MYVHTVMHLFLAQAGMIAIALALFVLTFWLTRSSPMSRPYTWTSFFFVLLALVGIYIYAPAFRDEWNYLHRGDEYVEKAVCVVKHTTGTTAGRIMFGEEHLRCTDGNAYDLWFTWLPPGQGKVYIVHYLPLSHDVLALEAVTGREE